MHENHVKKTDIQKKAFLKLLLLFSLFCFDSNYLNAMKWLLPQEKIIPNTLYYDVLLISQPKKYVYMCISDRKKQFSVKKKFKRIYWNSFYQTETV